MTRNRALGFASSLILLMSAVPAFALPTVELNLGVEPARVEIGEELTVTVSGEASCPRLIETNAADFVLEVLYSGLCVILPPDPAPFSFTTTVQLFEPGLWEVRLIDVDAPENPGAIAATVEVSVVDPDFSITFTPPLALAGDTIVATVAGFGSCLIVDNPQVDLAPGSIGIRILDISGICDPPAPPEAFEIDVELGQLAPGEYLAELFIDGGSVGMRMTDATLLVSDGFTRNLALEAEPTRLADTEPVVVTISGEASCPELLEQTVGDGFVEFVYRGSCLIQPTPPEAFELFALVDPLPAGIWEFRLIDLDIPVTPPPVVQSIDVTVTDPTFAIEVTPSPATVDDEVLAKISGIAVCLGGDPTIDFAPGRVVFGLRDFGQTCDPPMPPEPFEIVAEVGSLAAGEYVAELLVNEQRVTDAAFEVLAEAPTCVPTPTTLCLNQGRFRVDVAWATGDGNSGVANPIQETDDTGLFWFFNDDNVELVVKVLDGCDTTIPNFWVFAAGLTDVGVLLGVTDTVTGESVVYESPAGQKFEPITDTAAFDICPNG